MVTHHHVKRYLHKRVQCHTCFGTFHGIIIHCTKHHIVLGSIGFNRDFEPAADMRPYPMGPGGGPGWGGGPGYGGGPGPGGGGGWNIAIPLAAILGITAVGMHWW